MTTTENLLNTLQVCEMLRTEQNAEPATDYKTVDDMLRDWDNDPVPNTPEDQRKRMQEEAQLREEQARSQRGEARLSKARWPAALIKAASDPYTYHMSLRTGQTIHFEYAVPDHNPAWVHLFGASFVEEGDFTGGRDTSSGAPRFVRGIEVRVDDIVWCCDNPWK